MIQAIDLIFLETILLKSHPYKIIESVESEEEAKKAHIQI